MYGGQRCLQEKNISMNLAEGRIMIEILKPIWKKDFA
jgi:hypothetical protein